MPQLGVPLFQLRTGANYRAREPHVIPGATNVATHFTEFYCQSNGSNLNAGSTTDAAAIYTSTNGNWSTTTNQFIPTDGSNPIDSGVQAGQYISIYNDGASVAVYVARITSVTNATNGAINISSSVKYGTAPTTSATGRSVKVGGAWLGPNGASNFPFALAGNISVLVNSSSDMVRVNFKNDQTYSVTAALAFTSAGNCVLQGYTSLPGDSGRATFSSNITTGVNFTLSSTAATFIDLSFVSTGASGTNDCFANSSGSGATFVRCAFSGGRGAGLNASAYTLLLDCEAFDCNKSNTVGSAAIKAGISAPGFLLAFNCYVHDLTAGANADAFALSGASLLLVNCIISKISGNGITTGTTAPGGTALIVINNDFYKINGDAIKINYSTASGFPIIQNNNFIKVARPINNTTSSQGGILYNNARMGNLAVDLLKSIWDTGTDFAYSDGITPWNAPDTGDFSKILAAAIGVGRSVFTETDGANSGTTSFPDIGATQAQPTAQSFSITGTQTLPFGYIGHLYGWKWFFAQNVTVTVAAGSLPPGLSLVTVSPSCIAIQGTPTTVGIYDFTLRATAGTSTGDSPFEITVLADPDEGIGGLLGGLRPTC